MSLNQKELQYAIESNIIFHEFTMDSLMNQFVTSANKQVVRIDSMQLDYHLRMVGNAYNSFRRLTLDRSMMDRASRAISNNPNSTFTITTRIPDENEITEIRPKAIIRYINMIDKGLSDISKKEYIPKQDKKENKLTSYNDIMDDLAPDLFDGNMTFFRDECRYNVTAIARTDSAHIKSINVDTINYQIIPWIYNFNNVSQDMSDMVKDYRATMEYIRNNVPRIINNAARLRQQGVQRGMANNRYAEFSIKATKNLLNIISFLTVMVMRKINTTTEIMNRYTEVCRCFLEYISKEVPIVKEDFSAEDEYIPGSSWYKCINRDISEIARSCESILDYYSQYNDLSKNELLILNDLDKSDIIVNPYNLDKSLSYATYDIEPYNIKDAFYNIESGLTTFEQTMTDEFKFANKIISESGLTLDLSNQYREKLEPITSMTRYSSQEAIYSRSIPFMICKELMSMPSNLKIIMELANKCYCHAVTIRDKITSNDNKMIKDDFVLESLRTFMNNFVESFKSFAGEVYDSFVDRVNALNRHLNGLHLPDRVDETTYFGVEESFGDLNSDPNLISFDDTMDQQLESFRDEEKRTAKLVLENYISKVRGTVFTEENEGNGKSERSTSETEQQKSTPESKPTDKASDSKDENTKSDNKESDSATKNEDENDSNSDESDKSDEKKEKFFDNLMEKVKRALLSYLNKMRERLDEEFTSKDFASKINAVMNDDAIKYLEDLSEGRYNNKFLKTAVQGYVGPMYGPNNRSVNGKSYEELENAVKNFDVNFKNIDTSVIANATEENYRKVILEQFFHKTLMMSNVTVPDNIRSDIPMSEVTDFIKERIYETWSYGGLDKKEGGSDNEIGKGPETGSPKKKFVNNEVIKFLKYCKANNSETPAGWLPDKTTLENTLDKLKKSFSDAYDKAGSNDSSNKTDDDKNKGAEEKKKRDDLIKKKIEFCGTCFNTADQAFKDCIISRARDYINILNRLVPDEIRNKNGGKPEGIKDEDDNSDNGSDESSNSDNE